MRVVERRECGAVVSSPDPSGLDPVRDGEMKKGTSPLGILT